VSPNGKTLYVANAKGFGAGPNGGPNFKEGPEGDYIGDITHGFVSIISSIPDRRALKQMTARVLANNGFVSTTQAVPHSAASPVPPPGQPSTKIHHVVFIVRENRTFDEVLGDLRIAAQRWRANPAWRGGARTRW